MATLTTPPVAAIRDRFRSRRTHNEHMPKRNRLPLFVSVLAAASLLPARSQQFLNPSFEVTPTVDGSQLAQGIPPSQWIDAADITPGADSYGPGNKFGLDPSAFGHFIGKTAADGEHAHQITLRADGVYVNPAARTVVPARAERDTAP